MKKLAEFYRGKAKTVYHTSHPSFLILEFRNDISILDGQCIKQFDRKGMINNKFNFFIMNKLAELGIPTQIEQLLSDNETLVKKLDMIPVECVIRNRAAGSLVRRLGIEEGQILNPPLLELFFKNDSMHDPIINASYCTTFNLVSDTNLVRMQQLTKHANNILTKIFDKKGIILVDFKLEFGLFNNQIILGDEFSPDVSRLWDKKTLKKMDKDRLRQNLGGVIEAYEEVAIRIGVSLT
ncbi:phosphoribosylaminoimidazolesuccinocarboxamide synthase [Candidatus Palibaumannia cicadellinicola]|uniref:Phosphoribosylaminoimidazole-succinocarboxamide synthase n=1 Tax=Baumannia cicadellinicola subsp. Homalodisca coagulata TaxID=374463 RepID=PUR7_BAUCH|nr:phosphoribosylaminoimidazolesuccinocarboxamide synthase [Candidatus Baumannia cicadellinicola]Q1LU15.1 RecName: Full=Phosphoribosylaminoimidazole-succinocarboxamide synthase; AltName: Full=SAICAR synthetase [Baumannia cicadellinicola str. Hc (Homalodisca coagulata)]ABF13773.1 phosphoribosylaminoimidazole-succinocarboxamide synthase [Baumannia cicadellinicola str. Hc (Homalodisca coagulata)]MCJ7462468.1 phosphoribosylaminoimidazolesuccinocarboxamide synthase [Candidatus Baumannia cicadellinico